MKRARIAMRLKDGKNPPKIRSFGRAEGCSNLSRVMGIIVDDSYAVVGFHLESANNAAKAFQSACNDAGFDSHITSRCKGGGGIQDIVHAGNIELKVLDGAAIKPEYESGTEAFNVHVGDADIGRSRSTVSDDSPLHLRNEGLNARLIEA